MGSQRLSMAFKDCFITLACTKPQCGTLGVKLRAGLAFLVWGFALLQFLLSLMRVMLCILEEVSEVSVLFSS